MEYSMDLEATSAGTVNEQLCYQKTSAKAQVFNNLDLMEIVFEAVTFSTRAPDVELLWAALTCRCFFNPAMNILWRSLGSPYTVVSLFRNAGRISVDKTKTPDDNGHDTTIADISEGRLARADQYYRRVRHIQLYRDDARLKGTQGIWSLLHELRPFNLLPCLQSVSVLLDSIPDNVLPSLLLTMISPTLSIVWLHCMDSYSADAVTTFLSHLVAVEPQPLHTLFIDGNLNFEQLHLLERSSVSNLEIPDLDMALSGDGLLASFSRIRNLRTLSLRRISSCSTSPGAYISLDLLESLLVGGPPDQLCAFFREVKSLIGLKTLSMDFTLPDGKSPGDFALQNQCLLKATETAPSIKTFRLRTMNASYSDPCGVFNWDALGPIEQWKSLEHLDIDISAVAALDIDDIDAPYCIPWRSKRRNSLETLKISVGCWTDVRDQYFLPMKWTPLDVSHIAECCPSLYMLEIPMHFPIDDVSKAKMQHALDDDPAPCFPVSNPIPHRLEELKICMRLRNIDLTKPKLSDVVVFSEYLDFVFPRLKTLTLSIPDTEGKNGWCEDFEAMVGDYRL